MTAESPETFAELFRGAAFIEAEAERLRQEGRQEGEAQARVDMLNELIRTRFGDATETPQIVEHLTATRPGRTALEASMAARSLDDLRA